MLDRADSPGTAAAALHTTPAAPRYRQVAAQLGAWGAPDYLVECALALRQIERGAIGVRAVEAALGAAAAEVAEALALASGPVPRPSLQGIERTWKLFLVTYLHPSAGLLKIAELLMQLRGSADAEIGLSAETIGAAAEMSARLGLLEVRSELLDVQARLADPHLARRARELLDQSQPARLRFFGSLEHQLGQLLRSHGIEPRIERRPRKIYQVIDDGLEGVRGPFPWADVAAITVAAPLDCYRALGAINGAYPVVEAHLRDYIGCPRPSGYQALHTTIEFTAEDGRAAPVELRLLTPEMDDYNRAGYLSYLAGNTLPSRRPTWWTERRRWVEAYHGRSAELFVFTPKGETIFLPPGATVLDFAVRVHSDLGVYCRGARVNGTRVPPGERLDCADVCEVLIDQHGAPLDHRLIDLATTTAAKSRIRRALQRDHSGAARGKQTFRDVLGRLLRDQEVHASQSTIDQQVAAICRARGYHTVDAYYRAVARGEAAPDQFARVIVDGLLAPRIDLENLPASVRSAARRVRLAQCCRPGPSRPAVAVAIHSGRELKIHAAECASIAGPAYPVAWRPADDQAFVADIVYESWDRPGLIHQITGAVHGLGQVNIRSFTADVPEPSLARVRFSIEARSREQIEAVRRALEALPERRQVDVQAVTLIDEGLRLTTPLANPYGPQPVGRWPLFVGREAEVRQIVALLTGEGIRHVLVRGPKRIGKSSLLEHLSRYHLSDFKVPSLLNLQSLPTDELRFARLVGRFSAMIAQQAGPRAGVRPLDPGAIAADPIGAFAAFLAQARGQGDADRFAILIDELGVVASRLRGEPAQEFFDQWRALLNNALVYEHLAFIVALPDIPLQRMSDEAGLPGHERVLFRVGELGQQVRLGTLDPDNARELITAPIRSHLEYRPDDLALLLRETGGHPYYIHLACSQIVTAIQIQQRRAGVRSLERQAIPAAVVGAALEAVFHNDDAFYHVLADSTPGTSAVLQAISDFGGGPVGRARLRARLARRRPAFGDHDITWALEERPDLLRESEGTIDLRVALVARWLRRHA